tara:strand:- start:271 stop:822 length:552 start_codon:yes stop_codon:yes gene_type:complete
LKFLLRDSIVAGLFYFTTFFFWVTLIVPLEQDFLQTTGSLLYLPAAGRILPVLFFGIKTIPTLFLSSLIAWNFFWPYELYEFRNLGLFISYSAILVAWGIFKYLDAEISFDSKLKLSNWRHIVLFILLCSLLNGLLDGAFYSTDVDIINPLISLRFFVGDVTGTIFILLFCMLIISAFDIKRN